MPVLVCDELHQAWSGDDGCFLHIRVTADAVGDRTWDKPSSPASLGGKIADLIRAELGADAGAGTDGR